MKITITETGYLLTISTGINIIFNDIEDESEAEIIFLKNNNSTTAFLNDKQRTKFLKLFKKEIKNEK